MPTQKKKPTKAPKPQKLQVQYVRNQTGHSLTLHILLCFVLVGFFTIPYYSLSKNHYWHV